MLSLKPRFTRLALSLALTTVVAIGATLPAFAADTVTQSLTGGSLAASVANVTLAAPVAYSHANQNIAGTMVLTADDSSGTGAGWNVTISSSDFIWSQGSSTAITGTNILATNFSIGTPAAPAKTAGQAVDATPGNGPEVPAGYVAGDLSTARKVISAGVGFGQGTYTQNLPVTLTIPGQSHAGTYTATLTTTISAAP